MARFVKRIGARTVKELRKALGLNKKEFARKIGFHPYSVRRWETGTKMNSAARKAVLHHFKDEIRKLRSHSEAVSRAPKREPGGPKLIINNQGRGVRIVIDILPL